MKQSGSDVPEWMNNLPKLTKRDKRRIKQKAIQRKDVDAESKPFKRKQGSTKSPRKPI